MRKVSLNEAVHMLNRGSVASELQEKPSKKFTMSEALDIAKELDVDFDKVKFTPEGFLDGMNTELEHGTVDYDTNVTDDNPIMTGKIALAHLNETPYYYNEDIGIEAWEEAIKSLKGSSKGKKIRIF
jgi:hypothetical protein